MNPSQSTNAKTTTNQPQAANEMNVMNPVAPANKQAHCEHQHKAARLRGGGPAKDYFLAAIGCFLCCEGCKDVCECCADIICCPCEMCCSGDDDVVVTG